MAGKTEQFYNVHHGVHDYKPNVDIAIVINIVTSDLSVFITQSGMTNSWKNNTHINMYWFISVKLRHTQIHIYRENHVQTTRVGLAHACPYNSINWAEFIAKG